MSVVRISSVGPSIKVPLVNLVLTLSKTEYRPSPWFLCRDVFNYFSCILVTVELAVLIGTKGRRNFVPDLVENKASIVMMVGRLSA